MNYIQIVITFVITSVVAFALHTLDVGAIKLHDQSELKSQQEALQKSCKDDKIVTSEVSHDFESNLSNLTAERSRLQQSTIASMPVTITSPGHDGTSGKPGHVAKNATSNQLYDFATEAEHYRLQLKSCQSFVTKVWEEQKQ